VLAGSAGLGIWIGLQYKERIRILLQLRKMLLLMDGEIRSRHTPLPEAICRLTGKTEEPCRAFLQTLNELFREQQQEVFSVLWRRAVEEKLDVDESPLKKEDLELIKDFGEMFGCPDVRMQLDAIHFLQEQLLDRIGELSSVCSSKMRISKLMGVSAGIFLLIILL